MKVNSVRSREIGVPPVRVDTILDRTGRAGAYQRLDLAIYSPLSLALGAGTAAAVARAGRAG